MTTDSTKTGFETTDGSSKVIESLVKVVEAGTTPDLQQARLLMLQRLATQGSVVPSRIPAPLNITEIGGYLNLLERLEHTELRTQMLAATLGLAGPNPVPGLPGAGPTLFFASRANDRPGEGLRQAQIPVEFSMRSDLLPAFQAVLDTLHGQGARLPLVTPPRGLPPATAPLPADYDVLDALGRSVMLAPSAALVDPGVDAIVVARLATEATGKERLVARQLDAGAPQAAMLVAQSWTAFKASGTGHVEDTADRTYADVEALLRVAGWHRLSPIDTTKLAQPATWARLHNLTGLVAGDTRYGDELRLLYTEAQVAASALREHLEARWDGSAFVTA